MTLDRRRVSLSRCLIGGYIAAMGLVASAQDFQGDDPFGTPSTAQPSGVGDTSTPPSTPGAATETPPIDLSQYGPAIQAILERERTTPADLLEGILLLIDFDESELAKPWLNQLIAAAPDPQTQAELARRFGSHRLMRLASAKPLGVPARELAMSYLNAYANQVRDPARLSRLIEQLADPSVDAQYAAISGLVEAGEAAATALVAALGDAASDRHREAMQVALAELAPLSHGPLLAGLSADGANAADVRAASARVLGRMAPGHLAIWLLGPSLDAGPSAERVREFAANGLQRMIGRVPTQELAERMLQESIARHLDQTIPLDADENGQVDAWYWDDATQSPAMAKVDLHDAHVYYASKMAADLLALRPDHLEYQTQATMLHLAAPEFEGQRRDLLISDDPTVVRQILEGAIKRGIEWELPRAIASAARAMRDLPPDEHTLMSDAPAESPLVAALAQPSRGVRWEALATIMAIDPTSPYPGASRVMQTLADFVQAGPRPRAVVAMPVLEKAQTLAAAVGAQGYDVELATSGRDAIQAAGARGGADLVLVDSRISQPTLREVLYQLRAHPASSGAVVGILGVGEGLQQGRNVARDHQTAMAFPHPQGEDAVAAIIERLQESEAGKVALEELPRREEMSGQALTWLGDIAARQATFYDVQKYEPTVMQATFHAGQAGAGAVILAHFPSHESQLRLVDLVSNRAFPIEVREKAAEAFRQSVERYGVQLTTSDILAQYDHYNASESADRATQQVLAHVLDSIEAGRKRTVGP